MRDHWADRHPAIITDCISAMQRPGLDARSSFQLHAPLEQGARAHLLRHASPAVHDLALEQLCYTRDYYQQLAEAESGGPDSFGVLAEADAVRKHMAGKRPDALIREHLPSVLASTAGAAHIPILFQQMIMLPSPVREALAGTLPLLLSERARPGNLDLAPVFRRAEERAASSGHDPEQALYGLLRLNVPGQSVNGMVSSVLKAKALDDVLPSLVRADRDGGMNRRAYLKVLLRLAAAAMVQEPDTQVRFGWTHCFTLPSAVAVVAPYAGRGPLPLMAATVYFAAFWCTTATVPLDEARVQETLKRAAEDARLPGWETIINRAARASDAHFVKYVSSAFWISRHLDPAGEPLYRAAATRLARFWAVREPADRIRDRMLELRAH